MRTLTAIGIGTLLSVITALSGCTSAIQPFKSSAADVDYETSVSYDLASLPPPKEKIVISTYKFKDQTGQYKPGTGQVGWSTAVTQGATSMLIKALQDAGAGTWFTVLERESLNNLLNERRIIRQTRQQYLKNNPDQKMPPLAPLLYAPILLDGGIVAYESNLLTGGIGARYFGLGGSTQYSRDSVTIYLRAISVQNGSVLKSILTHKTVFSISLDGGIYRFIHFQRLLEVEGGYTSNEPPQMAVLEAIEKAVYSLIVEGAINGLWSFADKAAGQAIIDQYLAEKKAGAG